jgi:hypothetical protein
MVNSSFGFSSHIFTKNQSRILNLHEILTIEIVLIKKTHQQQIVGKPTNKTDLNLEY